MKNDLNENIEILNKQIESQNSNFSSLVVEKNQEIEKLITNSKSLEKSNEEKIKDLEQQITQCNYNLIFRKKKINLLF